MSYLCGNEMTVRAIAENHTLVTRCLVCGSKLSYERTDLLNGQDYMDFNSVTNEPMLCSTQYIKCAVCTNKVIISYKVN